MNRSTAIALLIGITAAAGTGYFVLQHKREQQMQDEILSFANPNEKLKVYEVVRKMTPAELSDTLRLLKTTKAGRQITDPVLKMRLIAISKKYNIFT